LLIDGPKSNDGILTAMNKVLCVVGLSGSGKTEATMLLTSMGQFHRIYFGGVVIGETEKRGLGQEREAANRAGRNLHTFARCSDERLTFRPGEKRKS
jgi:ABC-type glutathione transport system ATPase component